MCRLGPDQPSPNWLPDEGLLNLTRTDEELSIVCLEEAVPTSVQCRRGWVCLRVLGPLDFSLVGVLAEVSTRLAEVGVSLLAFSTFDTDYFLVQSDAVELACRTLAAAGHRIQGSPATRPGREGDTT